jgi:hypothetical protein
MINLMKYYNINTATLMKVPSRIFGSSSASELARTDGQHHFASPKQ